MTYRFEVEGDVQPAHRPRATAIGGHARVYNDKRHTAWMKSIRSQVEKQNPPEPIQGAVAVDVTVSLLKPKSKPKRVIHHTVRPDVDNLAKPVLDALHGLIWRDDAQVVKLSVAKVYGPKNGALITIEEL